MKLTRLELAKAILRNLWATGVCKVPEAKIVALDYCLMQQLFHQAFAAGPPLFQGGFGGHIRSS